MALAVWRFIIGAPLTYSWLLVLMITTIVQNQLPGRELHYVLLHRSTNIHELGTDPLGVLFSSLLWNKVNNNRYGSRFLPSIHSRLENNTPSGSVPNS